MTRSEVGVPHEDVEVAVLGAGPAGLAAARVLAAAGAPCTVYEAADHVGGASASFRVGRHVFDLGLHCLFTRHQHVLDHVTAAIAGAHRELVVDEALHWRGGWHAHPPAANLWDYPHELARDCLDGMATGGPGAGDARAPTGDYADWCVRTYGERLSSEFLLPYVAKYWAAAATTLPAGLRTPGLAPPDTLRRSTAAAAPARSFYYPAAGGFGAYCEALVAGVDVRLGRRATSVDSARRIVRFSDGSRVRYRLLLSSIALPALIGMLDDAPDALRRHAAALPHTSVALVSFAVARPEVLPHSWVFSYDPSVSFLRLSAPGRYAPGCFSPGSAALQAEVYFRGRPPEPEALYRTVRADLARVGVLEEDVPAVERDVRCARYANTLQDTAARDALPHLHRYLLEHGIQPLGRGGRWDNAKFDEAVADGLATGQDCVRELDGSEARRPTRVAAR